MSTPFRSLFRSFVAFVTASLVGCADAARPASPAESANGPLPPRAVADSVTTPWLLDAVFQPTTNDWDPSSQGLVIDQVRTPGHGVAEARAGSWIAYRAHETGFAGVDSFYYVIRNAAGLVDSAKVFVTVVAPSGTPTPQSKPDSGGAWGGASARVNVARSLGIFGGVPWFAQSVVSAGHGAARIVGDSLEYTASRAFTGLDTVTYLVGNAWGATASRTALFQSKNPIPGYEPSAYRVVPPPTVAGTVVAKALNSRGQIAGYVVGVDSVVRAFRWSTAGFEDLGLTDGRSTVALAINDDGIVGGYVSPYRVEYALSPSGARPATWDGTVLTDLTPVVGIGAVRGITNDRTLLVTPPQNASLHGFSTWRDGQELIRQSLWVEGHAINQSGLVLCMIISTYSRTCVQDGPDVWVMATGRFSGGGRINDRGEVVGYSEWIPYQPLVWFRWQGNGPGIRLSDLYPDGALIGGVAAFGNDGTIVGNCASECTLFTLSGRYPLNGLLTDRSWTVTDVVQMAPNGDLLAVATNTATGYSGPVLLTR